MDFGETSKKWLQRNKKNILIGGSCLLTLIGTGVGYFLSKNGKISFDEWLKLASKEELREAYDKMMPFFKETGRKTFEMNKISEELGLREAKEWFEKHPPNLDPNFRWTDAARWDKD